MILEGEDVVFIFTCYPLAINNTQPDPQGPASDWADPRHAVVSPE